MTHDDAFMQAIIENPDDDTPRLIYADWLEEHGQSERANFIRTQVELARLTESDKRRPELEARERELLAEHGEKWIGPLRSWMVRWTFRRGCLEEVVVDVRASLEHVDSLRRLAPIRGIDTDLSQAIIPPAIIDQFPESLAREFTVLPIGTRRKKLLVAMRDPGDMEALRMIQFILNRDVEAVRAREDQLIDAMNRHYPDEGESVD